MKKVWFKAKKYGWGWYPASKEGWGATVLVGLAAAVAAVSYQQLSNRLPDDDSTSQAYAAVLLTLALAGIAAGFIGLLYRYGEEPRWQWGKK